LKSALQADQRALARYANAREARGEKNSPVITPLFILVQRFLLIGCFKPRDVRRENKQNVFNSGDRRTRTPTARDISIFAVSCVRMIFFFFKVEWSR